MTGAGASPKIGTLSDRAYPQTLYDAACMLLPSQLEELGAFRLGAPMANFRPSPPSALAHDLVHWARNQGDPVLLTLEGYLRATVPRGFL